MAAGKSIDLIGCFSLLYRTRAGAGVRCFRSCFFAVLAGGRTTIPARLVHCVAGLVLVPAIEASKGGGRLWVRGRKAHFLAGEAVFGYSDRNSRTIDGFPGLCPHLLQ